VRYQTAPRPDASVDALNIPERPRAIIRGGVARAASYIRTDPGGGLPSCEEQRAAIAAYAKREGHELVAAYEDLDAPGTLLYHKPALREAINNVKEHEDWEVLVVAHPRCVSENDSAVYELVHKFSLYGNRLESPARPWEESLATMKAYRREMSRR
jgi:DNA invertase Pin-like site-specific DNA recombinase